MSNTTDTASKKAERCLKKTEMFFNLLHNRTRILL